MKLVTYRTVLILLFQTPSYYLILGAVAAQYTNPIIIPANKTINATLPVSTQNLCQNTLSFFALRRAFSLACCSEACFSFNSFVRCFFISSQVPAPHLRSTSFASPLRANAFCLSSSTLLATAEIEVSSS